LSDEPLSALSAFSAALSAALSPLVAALSLSLRKPPRDRCLALSGVPSSPAAASALGPPRGGLGDGSFLDTDRLMRPRREREGAMLPPLDALSPLSGFSDFDSLASFSALAARSAFLDDDNVRDALADTGVDGVTAADGVGGVDGAAGDDAGAAATAATADDDDGPGGGDGPAPTGDVADASGSGMSPTSRSAKSSSSSDEDPPARLVTPDNPDMADPAYEPLVEALLRNLQSTTAVTDTFSDSENTLRSDADGTPAKAARLKCVLATVFSLPFLPGVTEMRDNLASFSSKEVLLAMPPSRKSVHSRESFSLNGWPGPPFLAAPLSTVRGLVDATLRPRDHLIK